MFRKSRTFKALILISILVLVGVVITLSFSAFSAANIVPTSRVGSATSTMTANTIKPAECASLTLTNIYYCSGSATCNATAASELILGSANGERINGQGGADCIVGGGGNDDIRGGAGADICIGGPGNDVFNNCSVTYP